MMELLEMVFVVLKTSMVAWYMQVNPTKHVMVVSHQPLSSLMITTTHQDTAEPTATPKLQFPSLETKCKAHWD